MRLTEYTVQVEMSNGFKENHKVRAFNRDEALMNFFHKADHNPALIKGAVKWRVL